jgi:phosphomannomutase
MHHQPDGTFPNGVPNPMLEENRKPTSRRSAARRRRRAGLGRGFRPLLLLRRLGSLHRGLLPRRPAGRGIPEARAGRPHRARPAPDLEHARDRAAVRRQGGAVQVGPCVHQAEDARVDGAYGGEMSAHHYFRDFAYCDSGMIPWLLVLQRISESGKSLSELVGERMRLFPCSGEINNRVPDGKAAISLASATTRSLPCRSTSPTGCRWNSRDWRALAADAGLLDAAERRHLGRDQRRC